MPTLLDCESCGGPMPADRRCCPHCQCKGSHLRRLALLATLGAAACGGDHDKVIYEPDAAYGPAVMLDLHAPDDASVPDAALPDGALPDGGTDDSGT